MTEEGDLLEQADLFYRDSEREKEDKYLEDHKSAIEAFKNSEVDLFIIVKKEGYNINKAKIFYYTRGSEEPAVRKDIDQQGTKAILKDWAQLEKFARNQQDVDNKSIPQNFINLLGICEEILPNGPTGIRRVWIYCKNENINRLWEWVHTGGDFWGDKFDIIRVPDKCEFTDDALEVDNESSLKCCNFAYLTGAATSSSKSEIQRYCREINPQSIKLNKDNMLSDLHTFDIIHVFTIGDDNKLEGSYINSIRNAIVKTKFIFHEIISNEETKKMLLTYLTHLTDITTLKSIKIERLDMKDKKQIKITYVGNNFASLVLKGQYCCFEHKGRAVKIGKFLPEEGKVQLITAPHFLFLNMCGCEGIKSEILKLASPKTWIDTCFNIPEKFASDFEKKFYKELCCNKTNVAEALKKARGGLQNNACRFAYVLNGNPCVIIKVGKKS
jgi:hypothetical protein